MSLAPDLDVLPTGHCHSDTQEARAGGDTSAADGQTHTGAQWTAAFGSDSPDGADDQAAPTVGPLRPEDALLAIYADALDDFERVRIATENRLRALSEVKGMDDTPEADRMRATSEALAALEHGVELELKRALRKHPLGPWVKRTVGVGEKQAARLLASLGPLEDRRSPAQVWAYCGWVPGLKRQKGVKSNWNAKAKSRSWLIADKCVMAGIRKTDAVDDSDGYDLANRYAITDLGKCYLDRRKHTAETHPDWTDGHSHNDALRYVAKRVLRDMWREAKAVAS